MSKNLSIFEKHPKLAIAILSSVIFIITISFLAFILNLNILQDAKDSEKYSVADKIEYAIRCNGNRHIKLRENTPNTTKILTPSENFETLENKKYILKTDKNGLIEPAIIHKNPDLQIFFIGGSTTECEMVDGEFRFPYLVGRNLEKLSGLKINSDNAARSGNNSLHSINIMVNKLLPYNPSMIVMMHNINDLSTLIYEGSYWNNNKSRSPLSCAHKNNDNLKNKDEWVNSIWQKKILESKDEQEKLVNKFKANLKLFIYIAKSHNIIPVLMTQPNRIEGITDFKTGRGEEFDKIYQDLYKKFNQAIRLVGKENHVLVIDLAKHISQDKKYIYDQVHMNKEGSIMSSNVIAGDLYLYLNKTHFKKNINNQHQ